MYPEYMKYTAAGFTYWLMPECWQDGNKAHLVGAYMYNTDGEYIGFWPNNTMPRPLIKDLVRKWKGNRMDSSNNYLPPQKKLSD